VVDVDGTQAGALEVPVTSGRWRADTIVPAVVTAVLFAASAPFALYPALVTAGAAWATLSADTPLGPVAPLLVYALAYVAHLVVPVVSGLLLGPHRPVRFALVALAFEAALWLTFLVAVYLA